MAKNKKPPTVDYNTLHLAPTRSGKGVSIVQPTRILPDGTDFTVVEVDLRKKVSSLKGAH